MFPGSLRLLGLPLVLSGLLAACDTSGDSFASGDDTSEADSSGKDFEDSDHDTIMDIHEGDPSDDQDGDGDPNCEDPDSDDDGILDREEAGDHNPYTAPVDSDGDGTPDFLDEDSDDNGLDDEEERGDGVAPADTDGDGVEDFRDVDNDGDDILDEVELGTGAGGPVDSDADGTPDYLDIDSDDDGIGDVWEGGTTDHSDQPVNTDGDEWPDYLDDDSDGDGFPDAEEGAVSDGVTEPRDTDGDGIYDFADTDSDGDGIDDEEEVNVYGTDPYDADSDGDGQSDGAELEAGTDPLDALSTIEGIYVEVPERTQVEEEFDFELRIRMGDLVFNCDTTGSMGPLADAMAAEFGNIVSDLNNVIDDMAYGYATFDDYTTNGFADPSYGDRPWILQQQITTDVDLVDAAIAGTPNHFGGDGDEDDFEAVYQTLSGAGYDMDCDGTFDQENDILPFLASSSDPFGGTEGEHYDPDVPDTGTRGGVGFREYALPIVMYATNSGIRDPDTGSPSPGGCPTDAGSEDVREAAAALGATLIGISVGGTGSVAQMTYLAQLTNSYADTDGDGVVDDPLVFHWGETSTAEFRSTIVTAVQQLVSSVSFERVELEVEGDDHGFVTAIEPATYEDIDPGDDGETLSFSLTFRGTVAATTEDQIFSLTLNVLGDSTTLLDSYDILVVVPGATY